MEADAILNVVEDAYLIRCFIIYFAVIDDGGTMLSVLKHPLRGA